MADIVKLQKEIIEEIVEILAEELDISSVGLEEKEVLMRLVSLSIAVYLSKLNPENNKQGTMH